VEFKKMLITYTESRGRANTIYDTAQRFDVMLKKHGITSKYFGHNLRGFATAGDRLKVLHIKFSSIEHWSCRKASTLCLRAAQEPGVPWKTSPSRLLG
jgi:hypothetical protein